MLQFVRSSRLDAFLSIECSEWNSVMHCECWRKKMQLWLQKGQSFFSLDCRHNYARHLYIVVYIHFPFMVSVISLSLLINYTNMLVISWIQFIVISFCYCCCCCPLFNSMRRTTFSTSSKHEKKLQSILRTLNEWLNRCFLCVCVFCLSFSLKWSACMSFFL